MCRRVCVSLSVYMRTQISSFRQGNNKISYRNCSRYHPAILHSPARSPSPCLKIVLLILFAYLAIIWNLHAIRNIKYKIDQWLNRSVQFWLNQMIRRDGRDWCRDCGVCVCDVYTRYFKCIYYISHKHQRDRQRMCIIHLNIINRFNKLEMIFWGWWTLAMVPWAKCVQLSELSILCLQSPQTSTLRWSMNMNRVTFCGGPCEAHTHEFFFKKLCRGKV